MFLAKYFDITILNLILNKIQSLKSLGLNVYYCIFACKQTNFLTYFFLNLTICLLSNSYKYNNET